MRKSISIVIPTYNEEKFLPELIDKIKKINFSKLNLSHEIIVVNDGSTDNTKQILSKIDGISVLEQDNKGKGCSKRYKIFKCRFNSYPGC